MNAEEILHIFPQAVRGRFRRAAEKAEGLHEIRLAVGRPVRVIMEEGEFFLRNTGKLTRIIAEDCWILQEKEMAQFLDHVCSYSRYAYEEDIRQGFLTVPGGHRIGIAGQVILKEDGGVKNMKYISYANIRISHEIPGAAGLLMPYLYEKGRILNTILIGPPLSGKTTVLRDMIRQLSYGGGAHRGRQVAVVDERSEIAGSYMGIPGNDLGLRTDILDSCPKSLGMLLLVRSMAPEVIAVDEIGGKRDADAILEIIRCGCSVIATMHGSCMEEMKERGIPETLFDCVVLLERRGREGEPFSILKRAGEGYDR